MTPARVIRSHRRTREGCHVYTVRRYNARRQRWEEHIVLAGAPIRLPSPEVPACA